jgi:N-acetylmuramoyl-L-alanine amidase
VVTWVADGEKIDVVKKGADWSKITVARNDKTGYIRNEYIEYSSDGTTEPSTDGTALAGVVSGGSVNMRTGPGTGFGKIKSLSKGTKLKIWEESGNWYYVTALSGEKGWMSKTYVSQGYAMKTTASVNFRKSANGAVISTLEKGTDVEVISVTGSWSKVKVGSTTGYVFSKYIQ